MSVSRITLTVDGRPVIVNEVSDISINIIIIITYSASLSKRRRYCVARRPSRCHAVCVSAALVSAAKVMRCIQCSLVVIINVERTAD